ncbi:MAG: 5'-3' exonuclease H3TH domain-containing protein, partial [Eubacteriales bacterium]|nr:5'-3' exonuclease H3TH domain-containing protein [Eubacteriales bacterium]
MKNRIVIIDGNSLINRAYYAMQRPMITKDGIYTQGVYGFINMLTRIIDDYSPDYITVTFDRKSPTFRHIEYDDYKAGRKKMPPELAMQFPILKDVLHAMNIKTMEIDGFEADDIIGTVARVSEEEGLEPLIITGDKDALQLCTDKTKVLITKKGISDFDLYDREKMIERYQLTPQQFIDLKGLMGDQSDNIPGIPGVGEKTGIKLLTQFETMDNLLAHTDEIANAKLRQKVEDNIQMAVMSKRLATINKYVPIEFNLEELKSVEPNLDMLINQYVKLEFNSFLKRLKSNNQDSLKENVPTENQVEKIIINNTEGLSVIESLPEKSKIILKVFSDNNHIEKPVVSGVSMLSEKRYIYVDCQDKSIFEKLIDVFNEKNFEFLGHDLVKDYFS